MRVHKKTKQCNATHQSFVLTEPTKSTAMKRNVAMGDECCSFVIITINNRHHDAMILNDTIPAFIMYAGSIFFRMIEFSFCLRFLWWILRGFFST